MPVEYAECSARHLVALYRTARCDQQRRRIRCALDSLSADGLAAWLADEQEFHCRVGQHDITALTRGHSDWPAPVRDQIDIELSIVEARASSAPRPRERDEVLHWQAKSPCNVA